MRYLILKPCIINVIANWLATADVQALCTCIKVCYSNVYTLTAIASKLLYSYHSPISMTFCAPVSSSNKTSKQAQKRSHWVTETQTKNKSQWSCFYLHVYNRQNVCNATSRICNQMGYMLRIFLFVPHSSVSFKVTTWQCAGNSQSRLT
jgi:hypothetical protein